MNYCVLNGVNSNTITGLMIQELPAVSKPLMRTQIEEIDGRDGDIITELGYAAYDKTMEIGLLTPFDINEVIAYFASEGVVTFSNEPDKYYRYKIISQIDYTRLVLFRTATVTFHVQPFKYPASETALVSTGTSMTIFNQGNTTAKPKVTITGADDISLTLNGYQILSIELGDEGNITIDAESMDAYKSGVLKNRLVTGDYENLTLNVGSNTLAWTGDVTEVTVENYSRWI